MRNFIHVKDAVKAFMTILDKGSLGETYNIASRDEVSVMDLAKMLLGRMKPGEKIEEHIIKIQDRVFNDSRYHITALRLE